MQQAVQVLALLGFLLFAAGVTGFLDDKSAAICGSTDWYKQYVQRHHDMRAGKIPTKYFISFPVKAGLADMILGYISGFLWSLLTERVFLILRVDDIDNLCNQRTIEFGLDYRFANWSSFSIPKSDYACMMAPYPEKVACEDPSKISIQYTNGTWSPASNTLKHMPKVNNGFRSEFRDHDMTKFPDNVHDANILMFSSNWGISYNALHNPFHHDFLTQKMGFTEQNLFPCLFEFLFKMKPEVCIEGCKTTEEKLHSLGKSDKKTLRIGIHVREENAQEAPEHFHCADMITQEATARGLNVVYLLVTASKKLQEKMSEQYGAKLLLPMGKVTGIQGVHRYETSDTTPEGEAAKL